MKASDFVWAFIWAVFGGFGAWCADDSMRNAFHYFFGVFVGAVFGMFNMNNQWKRGRS